MASERPGGERLTVFSRLPLPGRSKTRLAPALGSDGAARYHHEMALRCLTTARQAMTMRPGLSCRLSITDELAHAASFFGTLISVEAQPGGDLGERMAACFREGRDSGIERQVIVGTDAPDLTVDILNQAFEGLEHHDMVLGPARDGGYYLIGLSTPPPPLIFHNMPWGGPEVLSLTLVRASDSGLSLRLLPTLDDVDRPEDVAVWRRLRRQWPSLAPTDGLSVVIPVLNEASRIADRVQEVREGGADEVIVVDGGSHDASVREAKAAGALVIQTAAGRARQMNAGARAASGTALLFLHADTRLSPGWRDALMSTLADSRSVGGAFAFRLQGRGWRYRLTEWLVALRCRLLNRPYGDQGLFCRSEAFFRLGGFPDVAVMEDLLFVRSLGREGRIRMLPIPAVSSPRNWEAAGFWRVFWAHRVVTIGYFLGIPLPTLARYRQRLLEGKTKG